MDEEKGYAILAADADDMAGKLAIHLATHHNIPSVLVVGDAPPTPKLDKVLPRPFKIPYKYKKTKRGTNMTPPKKKRKK